MSAHDARRALQVDGRLVWNPTDLSTAFPYGGTVLGFMVGHHLKMRQGQHVIRAEELGVAVDTIHAGEEAVFGAILSSWDADAVTLLHLDAEAGSTTGRPVLRGRVGVENKQQGARGTTKSGILYFAPNAKQHPGVLFHNAIPMRAEQADWQFNLARKFGEPFVFLAVPNASDDAFQIGLLEDLSL